MEKSRLKNGTRNNLENYGLNREMEIMLNKNSKKQTTITNSQYLNDRDMFNKFSNGNEIIDYTEIKHDESNYGMPIFNGQILNNKSNVDNHSQDLTKWEMVDRVGNVFNRLVLFNATRYHMSMDYFGTDKMNGRLFQTFFFDTER